MDSNYKYAQPYTRGPCASMRNVCLIIISMRCDVKNSQILVIFVEFPRAYDRAGRVWVENVVFPRNVRVHTNKDRGCLILAVVKCIFVRHQNEANC